MPISIGIFTASQSLDNIRSVDSEMKRFCQVSYLPYQNMTELARLYQKNISRFDGIMFSGPVPHDYIVENVGSVKKPHRCLDLVSRDYYLAVARLLAAHPGLDFSRVYFDSPSEPSVFRTILREDQFPILPQTTFARYKANLRSNMYNWYLEFYRSMWREERCDFIVTRFTNLAYKLEEEHIPHMLLRPCPETILDCFHALMNDIRAAAIQNTLTACCILEPEPESRTLPVFEQLEKQTQAAGDSQGCRLLMRKTSSHLEVITSCTEVRKLTRNYSSCFLTEKLRERFPLPLHIGWGVGFGSIDAYRNAKKALLACRKDSSHFTYLVTEAEEMVGPLNSNRSVSYDLKPDSRIASLAKSLGIAPFNLEKLLSLQKTKGMHEFTSADLVYFLEITPRSATRILTRLMDGHLARPVRSVNLSGTGRPTTVYEVDFESIL